MRTTVTLLPFMQLRTTSNIKSTCCSWKIYVCIMCLSARDTFIWTHMYDTYMTCMTYMTYMSWVLKNFEGLPMAWQPQWQPHLPPFGPEVISLTMRATSLTWRRPWRLRTDEPGGDRIPEGVENGILYIGIYILLYYIILYIIILYYIILCYIILYNIILYYIIFY
jgi:hypothetical protein